MRRDHSCSGGTPRTSSICALVNPHDPLRSSPADGQSPDQLVFRCHCGDLRNTGFTHLCTSQRSDVFDTWLPFCLAGDHQPDRLMSRVLLDLGVEP